MIDYFTIALAHGLIALALIRLLTREELDEEDLSADPAGLASDPAHRTPVGLQAKARQAAQGQTRPGPRERAQQMRERRRR